MSARIAEAFAEWRECRQAYDDVLYAQYERAAEACREVLLNDEARAKGVEPISLFMGPAARARAHASEELLEHWETHPRVTFEAFEAQWSEPPPDALGIIDQTIYANEDSSDLVHWRNDEVLELLREIRAVLVA